MLFGHFNTYRVTFLTGAPKNSPKFKSLYNLWHLEKFQTSHHGILYLSFLGAPVKKITLYLVEFSLHLAIRSHKKEKIDISKNIINIDKHGVQNLSPIKSPEPGTQPFLGATSHGLTFYGGGKSWVWSSVLENTR